MLRKSLAVILMFGCMVAPVAAKKFNAETTAMRVPAPSAEGQRAVVLVLENRPDVVSGEAAENHEGVSRELYGIPVQRATNDKAPMAAYLGERLRVGFQNAGYASAYLPSKKATSRDDRLLAVDAVDGGVFFVVDLRDWHYDFGGFKPSFLYDVTVTVYDGQKRLLAQKDFGGTELMPLTKGWKSFKERYAELYQNIFDTIFASPTIKDALEGKASLASASKGTVEERLAQLKRLLDQQLIDETTYEREKQRIVQDL